MVFKLLKLCDSVNVNGTSEGGQDLDWKCLCYGRLAEDGSPVPKHAAV